MTVYDDLATRIRGVARDHARAESPPTLRFRVASTGPLVLDQIDGDLVLNEGDPDFTIADAVDTGAPAAGDVVLVEQTGASDNPEWFATGVVKRGDDDA